MTVSFPKCKDETGVRGRVPNEPTHDGYQVDEQCDSNAHV